MGCNCTVVCTLQIVNLYWMGCNRTVVCTLRIVNLYWMGCNRTVVCTLQIVNLQWGAIALHRWILKNGLWKDSYSCRITCERSESAWERRIALHKSDQRQQQSVPTNRQFMMGCNGTRTCILQTVVRKPCMNLADNSHVTKDAQVLWLKINK